MSQTDLLRVWDTEGFRVEQADACAVPGYLVIIPDPPLRSLMDMDEQQRNRLGYVMNRVYSAIKEVIRPLQIYTSSGSAEDDTGLRFYVFPRTTGLTERWHATHPGPGEAINGGDLMDWARTEYRGTREEVAATASAALDGLRTHFTATDAVR